MVGSIVVIVASSLVNNIAMLIIIVAMIVFKTGRVVKGLTWSKTTLSTVWTRSCKTSETTRQRYNYNYHTSNTTQYYKVLSVAQS